MWNWEGVHGLQLDQPQCKRNTSVLRMNKSKAPSEGRSLNTSNFKKLVAWRTVWKKCWWDVGTCRIKTSRSKLAKKWCRCFFPSGHFSRTNWGQVPRVWKLGEKSAKKKERTTLIVDRIFFVSIFLKEALGSQRTHNTTGTNLCNRKRWGFRRVGQFPSNFWRSWASSRPQVVKRCLRDWGSYIFFLLKPLYLHFW